MKIWWDKHECLNKKPKLRRSCLSLALPGKFCVVFQNSCGWIWYHISAWMNRIHLLWNKVINSAHIFQSRRGLPCFTEYTRNACWQILSTHPCPIPVKFARWIPKYLSFKCWECLYDLLSIGWVTMDEDSFRQARLFGEMRYVISVLVNSSAWYYVDW